MSWKLAPMPQLSLPVQAVSADTSSGSDTGRAVETCGGAGLGIRFLNVVPRSRYLSRRSGHQARNIPHTHFPTQPKKLYAIVNHVTMTLIFKFKQK